jgi:hypothetical protein
MSSAEIAPRPVPTVDARASRVAQGLTALLVAVPIVTGRWPLLLLAAAHLASALLVGKRGNLGLLGFDALLAERLGPGELKDARPPRFANLVGLLFLVGAMVSHVAGVAWLGWALAGTVLVLAGLAAATGFCLGCKVYVLYRHVQPHLHHRTDAKHAG